MDLLFQLNPAPGLQAAVRGSDAEGHLGELQVDGGAEGEQADRPQVRIEKAFPE